jgi:hypothetical protein
LIPPGRMADGRRSRATPDAKRAQA